MVNIIIETQNYQYTLINKNVSLLCAIEIGSDLFTFLKSCSDQCKWVIGTLVVFQQLKTVGNTYNLAKGGY